LTTVTIVPGTSRAAGLPAALTPGGAQAVFRATLDALARPGTVRRLPAAKAEPLAGRVPAALLPLLALADLSTPACVVGHPAEADGDAGGRTSWDEIVRVATSAPRAALADARLVAALRPLRGDELGSLRTGTAATPEDGALACLAVSGIAIVDGAGAADAADAGDEADGTGAAPAGGAGRGDARGRLRLRLSGPGVPGTRAVIVTGLPAGFAAARRRLVAGFPAGADLLLIAPDGTLTGLPRTTLLSEETV
jgi:alpha-D-ribose 1-methylphosphonate 5-triphosphate synthase subunit PhnH